MMPPPADADATRAKAATVTRTRPVPARQRSTVNRQRPTAAPARRKARWPLAAAVALIILIAAVGGLYAASRELYFVGTDNAGLITLYRGVPYELPLGIHLYTTEYESTVPAAALPPRQRDAVLNHRLRGHGDAVDLIRSLERSQG